MGYQALSLPKLKFSLFRSILYTVLAYIEDIVRGNRIRLCERQYKKNKFEKAFSINSILFS